MEGKQGTGIPEGVEERQRSSQVRVVGDDAVVVDTNDGNDVGDAALF
jgi:hypothetical protein